jgi:two-component system, OmpR family, phosphate regulon sensor histidine kinase PhoR
MARWNILLILLIAGLAPLAVAMVAKTSLVQATGFGAAAVILIALLLHQDQPALTVGIPSAEHNTNDNRPSVYALLDTLPDPFLLIGPQERVLYANLAARAIYPGFEAGVLISTFVRHPEVLQTAALARQTGTRQTRRFTLQRPKARFIQLIAAPQPDGHIALIFIDETELYHAEHLRAGFLANVSHELRTPLASLSGYIETLQGHAKDDALAQEKFLAIMAGQADRMGRLIKDLLSLSRIEMDEHLAPTDTVDLAQVLTDVIDALSPIASNRNIALQCDMPAAPLPVTGDRDQLIQIIQNLIDNAIKYTPKGQKVMIRLIPQIKHASPRLKQEPLGDSAPRMPIVEASRSSERHYALLEIRDTGPGIEARHLPRLGGRFYRVEEGKASGHTGTGLGLAIVKHIVKRHQGSLHVQSKPGEGTVFSVALPLAQARP